MKKAAYILLFLILAPLPALAAEIWPECFNGAVECTVCDIIQLMINIASFILSVSGSVALLFIIIAGIAILTSAGNHDKLAWGKKTFFNSLIGLMIILAAYSGVNYFVYFFTQKEEKGVATIVGTPWPRMDLKCERIKYVAPPTPMPTPATQVQGTGKCKDVPTIAQSMQNSVCFAWGYKGSSCPATIKNSAGEPFRFPGCDSKTCFDCSGFARYVWQKAGVTSTFALNIKDVIIHEANAASCSDLQVGDIVVMSAATGRHVGIYIGGGKVIHNSATKNNPNSVKISIQEYFCRSLLYTVKCKDTR